MKDYNFLKQNAFLFKINRIPEANFRVVSVNLPSMEIPPPDEGEMAGMQYFPGSAPVFGELAIRFAVDENMLAYEELFDWITMQKFGEHGNVKEKELVSDGFLVLLTNESNPNVYIYFKDMFPMSISELNFESTTGNPTNIECVATFRYSYFTIKRDVKL